MSVLKRHTAEVIPIHTDEVVDNFPTPKNAINANPHLDRKARDTHPLRNQLLDSVDVIARVGRRRHMKVLDLVTDTDGSRIDYRARRLRTAATPLLLAATVVCAAITLHQSSDTPAPAPVEPKEIPGHRGLYQLDKATFSETERNVVCHFVGKQLIPKETLHSGNGWSNVAVRIQGIDMASDCLASATILLSEINGGSLGLDHDVIAPTAVDISRTTPTTQQS